MNINEFIQLIKLRILNFINISKNELILIFFLINFLFFFIL